MNNTDKKIPVRVHKSGKARFSATVIFNSKTVTVTSTKSKHALRALEIKLSDMGVTKMPAWEVIDFDGPEIPNGLTIPSKVDIKDKVESVKSVTKEDNPFSAFAAPSETSVENTHEVIDLHIPIPLPKTDCGLITPSSDLEAWTGIYRDAESYAAAICDRDAERDYGIQDIPGIQKDDFKTRYRSTVNLIMEERNAIGAYSKTPSGESYINVARRMGASVYDQTMQAFRAGEGARREMTHKNLNGNQVSLNEKDSFGKTIDVGSGPTKQIDPNTGRVKQVHTHKLAPEDHHEKLNFKAKWGNTEGYTSLAQEAILSGKVTKSKSSRELYTFKNDEQMRVAYRAAAAASSRASKAGKSTEEQRFAYKQALCISIREQGLPPHLAWEELLSGTPYKIEADAFGRLHNPGIKNVSPFAPPATV